MTNEKFVLTQTNRERKITGYGAFHKKNGSKSKRCSLPSDNLTAKQLRERSGEVKTYNLNKPMDWISFIQMPADLQADYLNRLIEKYGARQIDMADMLGIDNSTLSRYIKNKLNGSVNFNSTGKRKASEDWLSFVEGAISPSESAETEDDKSYADEPDAPQERFSEVKQPKESTDDTAEVKGGSITYEGKPAIVLQKAYDALNGDAEYEIIVTFRKIYRLDE